MDGVAEQARRARVVNRAYGVALMPDEIASRVPSETIDVLEMLEQENYIGDAVTLLRVWLEAMSRRG